MKLISRLALVLVAVGFTSCSTVTDMVSTHIPERHSGRASIEVDVSEQQAYLVRNGHVTASSRISSGREGHRTPIGRFRVIAKTRIIVRACTAITSTTLAASCGRTSMCGGNPSRAARISSARRCRSSSSSLRATGYMPVICRARPHRMAAFACRTGRLANSTARRISARQSS